MSEGARRWRLVLVLAVVAGGLVWVCSQWWEVRRDRRAMAEINEEIENSRFAIAARKLADFLTWRPGSDEALYLLGRCEKERGRTEAAAQAWDRVPSTSKFAPLAILGRMELLLERGELADAEQLVKKTLEDPRIDGSGPSILIGPVYCHQGRIEEAKRLIETRWEHLNQAGEGALERGIKEVWLYCEIQSKTPPVEATRALLDQAGRTAPEDDRIWLGKANLAIRSGSYDEAARWLDACLRRRPEDVPVWRARLDWAVATNRVAEARAALKHLPAELSTPAHVYKLAAWFAGRRGDVESERQALERLIAADPADLDALDRLAELAASNGQPDRAAELRRKRTETERIMARYEQLHARYQPRRDAVEMARLAEQLGRRFEARGFLTLAVAVDPDRDDLRRDLARLDQRSQTIGGPGITVAEPIAPEL